MKDRESLEFIRGYFDELFGRRNVDALDVYLDTEYFDDDIGDPNIDHIQSPKQYLLQLFEDKPTIGVEVQDAVGRDGVISAFLEWFVTENNRRRIFSRGWRFLSCEHKKS